MDFENNEQALMAAFHGNSPEAVEYIFCKYYAQLVVYAKGIVGKEDVAEDIAVDTFLKLLRKKENYTELKHVKLFLYVTCKNGAIDFLRYTKVDNRYRRNTYWSAIVNDGEGYDVADMPGHDYGRMTAELMQEISEVIERLPNRAKEIFGFIFYNKMTMPEIADHYGVHVNTIQREKSRIIEQLRNALSQKGLLDATMHIVMVFFLGSHLF